MALPEGDVQLIAQFCEEASSPEYADIARVEYEVSGNAVTIVEANLMPKDLGGHWLRVPAARLRYDQTAGEWTLYCFDRNSKAKRYDLWDPDFVQPGTVEEILAEIEADPTNIFWG